jgi:hypothetical protein
MSDPHKCAHPACNCVVSTDAAHGKYCSEYCKEAAHETEIRCDCQHSPCRLSVVSSGV